MALRAVLLRVFHAAVRLYFRRIERVGAAPDAATHGRLFVSNHHNALVDPILVLTDAACEISPIAKSTLWNIPGLPWLLDAARAVPLVRRKDAPGKDASANDTTFERIAAHLACGGNVLIFPEGKSHSEPRLAPLRTGASRMLLLAEQRPEAIPLSFQAVGLEFDARDKFRSRCLVLWGPVRALADVPGEGEERVRAVTAMMEEDLSELLVEGDTHEERLLIARVAEMLANDAGHDTLEGWNTFGRQVELAKKTLAASAPQVVGEVSAIVGDYFDELGRLGLRDAQLSGGRAPTGPKPWTRWIRRALLAPLAVLGIILFAPPYFATRLVTRLADEGDVVSTAKLGAGLLAHPSWAVGLIVASWLFLPTAFAAAATAAILLAPFVALSWLDAWDARAPGLASGASLADVARLGGMRRGVVEKVEAVRGTLGA